MERNVMGQEEFAFSVLRRVTVHLQKKDRQKGTAWLGGKRDGDVNQRKDLAGTKGKEFTIPGVLSW